MKAKHLIAAIAIATLSAAPAAASVFSGGSGSHGLQSLFNRMGYDYIDVTRYQTNLNFNMLGMVEFEMLSKNSSINGLSFGVLESRNRSWGTTYRHHGVFGSGANAGSLARFDMSQRNSTYGFFIQKQSGNRSWQQTRYYSYSPFNSSNAVQALFYENPMNSGEYLLAFEGMYVGNSHSDRSYNDMVVRMRGVHPTPEPATWVLLATGLIGVGIFAMRRREDVTA